MICKMQKVDGVYQVKTNYLHTTEVNLKLKQVVVEGESSSHYLSNKYITNL